MTGATRQLQRLSVLASAGLAAAMLAPLAAVSYWLVPLVFGAAYRGAVPLLWVLTPGSVFLACGQVTGDLLRGRRQPAVVAWAEGIAAIFTVALLFALLPLVGVYGAAIASTVSYGVALAVMLRRLSRLSRPPQPVVGEDLPGQDEALQCVDHQGDRHERGLGGGGRDQPGVRGAFDANAVSMASSVDLAGWHHGRSAHESGLVTIAQRLTRKRIFA